MFDPILRIGTEKVKSQAVGLLVDLLDQTVTQFDPLRGIDLALEHGVLHALAEIATGPRNTAQAAFPAIGLGADVVSDKDHHGRCLLPHKWGIAVEVATQVARHELGLEMPQQADGRLLANERVFQFLALAILVGNKDSFAGIV